MAKRTAYALQSAFKAWDDDGNGTITKEELKIVLLKLGNFKDKEVDEVLKQADTNGDGVIDYNEFVEWLAAPAAPLGAAALLSEGSVCYRAEGHLLGEKAATPSTPSSPALWKFGPQGRKPVTFHEAIELGVSHTIAAWVTFEEPSDKWASIVSDPTWGLQIGLTPAGGISIDDPRNKGSVPPEVSFDSALFDKWVLFIARGICSSTSPSEKGSTEFLVGSDVSGLMSIGSVPTCASGLVLREFGCVSKGLRCVASVAIWQRRLENHELKEIFLWDADKMGVVTAEEKKWARLNRRQVPPRTEEEEELFAERLTNAAEGKAPRGTLNIAGLKVGDADLSRILDAVERSFDTVSAIDLRNNFITEDGIQSELAPFLASLTLPMRVVLSANADIGATAGSVLLKALPSNVAWSVDVQGTQISADEVEKLLNDTPEASNKARQAAMERRRTAEMITKCEEGQADIEKRWAQECDKATASDDEGPGRDALEAALKDKKGAVKFPEGQAEKLKLVREQLAADCRLAYDRTSGKKPPENCGGGQLLAHLSYLGYQLTPRSPEDFGLRLRSKSENSSGGHQSLHSAVENGSVEVVSASGKGFGRGALTLQLKNLSNRPITVVIPAGTVFQHIAWVHKQNLLVGRSVEFRMEPGASLNKKIGAYSMNLTCACSDKEKLHLTPFLFDTDLSLLESQGKVWDHFEERFKSLREQAGFKEKKKKGKKK